MKHTRKKLLYTLLILFVFAAVMPVGISAETTDPAVLAVISQLESIDTLQEIQDKRADFAVNSRYFSYTTNQSIINAHNTKRGLYESYVTEMFAARAEAQQAYNALSEDQKAQIDPALVEKLNPTLNTVFHTETFSVTPRSDAYSFEVPDGNTNAYETSNHITPQPQIPTLFILTDTADGKTEWTPNGTYQLGVSNYEAAYCCDVKTNIIGTSHYKRVNVEDSSYYSIGSAHKIRAILTNAYPYITMEEMKAKLIEGGLSEEFVNSLNRSDLIAAIQMAIWAYANNSEADIAENTVYGASYDIPNNTRHYMNPLHDHTNELWTWWTTSAKQVSYDPRAAHRVNTLVYYLCNLPGEEAEKDTIVITDIEMAKAELTENADNTYRVGLYVSLNCGSDEKDNIKIVVTSHHANADGTQTVTDRVNLQVQTEKTYQVSVDARPGDTITAEVEGTQHVERGVYVYEPEGGRSTSQTLVAVSQGNTNVKAEMSILFEQDITQGLRIYKTTEDSLPVSDITFRIYRADGAVGEKPTAGEFEKYATPENLAGEVITDTTGYARLSLENGTYMVVEEHNREKTTGVAEPCYITIPNADGNSITSIYPKNELITPPTDPPDIPVTPDNVYGTFSILKTDDLDNTKRLEGAEFQVYRRATETDTDTKEIIIEGKSITAAPVLINGEPVILTTDENGKAVSPNLTCDDYLLVETKAPDGYHLPEEAVWVTVHPAEMEQTTITVTNQSGSLLPETGSSGIAHFTISGILLMVLASGIAVLIRKKKKNHLIS